MNTMKDIYAIDYAVHTGPEPRGYASPNPQVSSSPINVSGASIDLTFYINNDPGNALTPTLNVTLVTDQFGCTDATVRSGLVHIKAMPQVGAFN
jgi:hypothetical protein